MTRAVVQAALQAGPGLHPGGKYSLFQPATMALSVMSIADTQVGGSPVAWEALQPAEFLTARQAIGEPGTQSSPG